MDISIDTSEGLIYIKIKTGKIFKTVELDSVNEIFVDLDKKNKVIGFEIINPINITTRELNNFARRFNVPQLRMLSPQGMKDIVKGKELIPA
ncbi:MAG: DUF2283 domain-containing protein [Candidatus Margulisbacteria bacterium]|nr:DUF2283 domain-containing protein [Candidatus Margulisiibacteriota bacterium]MBU1617470.1 DUF2283 domain-containing protein [Candidatus Margulisiibacteriota bacterium]MBU1867803.1 DUF2283 domain-containing protein [Candidatus Margulisiibacteriota bacterium]